MAYFRDLIARRRSQPGDDLLSGLLEAEEQGDKLTEVELLRILYLLLVAGHETTVNLIANGVLAFARHPDQFERLRADPSLTRSAVEEVLRFDPPVHIVGRIPLDDIELSCGTVHPSERLVTLPAAANHDERQFNRPETFDIGRRREPSPRLRVRGAHLHRFPPGPPGGPGRARHPRPTLPGHRAGAGPTAL